MSKLWKWVLGERKGLVSRYMLSSSIMKFSISSLIFLPSLLYVWNFLFTKIVQYHQILMVLYSWIIRHYSFKLSFLCFPSCIQDIASTLDGRDVTTNVHWMGTVSKNLVTFNGGFQLTLLPGGIYMGCPCDVAKSVQESKSFHLEFCWLESPGKRQRLVRTYDVEGLAVSSTYFFETKVWLLVLLF